MSAESFFGLLKEKLFPKVLWEKKEVAMRAISDFVQKYYSVKRIKMRLGNFSPLDYELLRGFFRERGIATLYFGEESSLGHLRRLDTTSSHFIRVWSTGSYD